MILASYLLLVVGLLGATDIALYHATAHGIRHHPDSWKELITNAMRGPTYAVLFLMVPNCVPHGPWYFALVGLLVMDVGISVADFLLEQESRAFLGGLPPGEYVLHTLIAIVFGAFACAIGILGPQLAAGGRLEWMPQDHAMAPHWVLRVVLAAMAAGVLISGIQDAAAAWRLWRLPKRGA
jgi:hypothetical protein